jgi:hypothetical protein
MLAPFLMAFFLVVLEFYASRPVPKTSYVTLPPRMSTRSYGQDYVRPQNRRSRSVLLPDSTLYIVTPCSRPDYLLRARATLQDEHDWIWIVVYSTKPNAWVFPDNPRIWEIWPGKISNLAPGPASSQNEARTFGNPQRNYGLDLIWNPRSFVYFLDDDNGVHPAFWQKIYPLLTPATAHMFDFITFDQERRPGWVFQGPTADVLKIDTAMFVTQRGLVADTRWTHEYYADGIFAKAMAIKAKSRLYANCTAAYYNFFKQNFSSPVE